MKIALLKGNRFNPWHLTAYKLLDGAPEITAFRADSEIQRYYTECDDGSAAFPCEPLFFDTAAGPMPRRILNRLLERAGRRAPRLLPFHERLRGYDLIHTWELFTDWTWEALEARRKWNIPVFVMVWDNIVFGNESDARRREIKARAIREADCFIVHTERSRRMLEIEGVAPARIQVLDPAVDTGRFTPGPARRAQLGLAGDEFVILFVGWLLPRKGIDFLLLALHELLRDPDLAGLKLRLAIVHSGPGRERVDALIRRLGLGHACTFLGALPYDRMPDVYRSADLFVLPSIATPEWQEQFGMAIMEAMACGLPVVSTWSGAIPEIVEDAARLCQPNDFLALYEVLRELALDPEQRAALGARGREVAEARFPLGLFAERLSAIYRKMR